MRIGFDWEWGEIFYLIPIDGYFRGWWLTDLDWFNISAGDRLKMTQMDCSLWLCQNSYWSHGHWKFVDLSINSMGGSFHSCLVNVYQRVYVSMYLSGWWFGTCFIFPNSWDDDPIWRTHIFQGVGIPPTRVHVFMADIGSMSLTGLRSAVFPNGLHQRWS